MHDTNENKTAETHTHEHEYSYTHTHEHTHEHEVHHHHHDHSEAKPLEQLYWPIKLWKAPMVSPYYHKAHLLIASDCSAFS